MKLEHLHPNCLHLVWGDVAPMLDAALKTGAGEYNVDQLKVLLVQGQQQLLVFSDEGKIQGAVTVVFENYPNDRIAFVTTMGGCGICRQDMWDSFVQWARSLGATKMRAYSQKSAARLWRQKFGVEQRYLIVEKSL